MEALLTWMFVLVAIIAAPVAGVAVAARFTRRGRWLSLAALAAAVAVFFALRQLNASGNSEFGEPQVLVLYAFFVVPGMLLGLLAALVVSSRRREASAG